MYERCLDLNSRKTSLLSVVEQVRSEEQKAKAREDLVTLHGDYGQLQNQFLQMDEALNERFLNDPVREPFRRMLGEAINSINNHLANIDQVLAAYPATYPWRRR